VSDRCTKVIANAEVIEALKFLSEPEHISEGNFKFNFLFTATLYLANPGLINEDTEEEEIVFEFKPMEDDGNPREERAFCNYINSLGIEGVKVRNLYADLVDGLILLKVLDRI